MPVTFENDIDAVYNKRMKKYAEQPIKQPVLRPALEDSIGTVYDRRMKKYALPEQPAITRPTALPPMPVAIPESTRILEPAIPTLPAMGRPSVEQFKELPITPTEQIPSRTFGISSAFPISRPTESIGIPEATGRGLVSGLTQIEASIGTGLQYVGGKLGIKSLEKLGKESEKYWSNVGKKYLPPEELQGSIIKNPKLMSKGAWWAYNVAQMSPSFAVAMIPAVGAARYINVLGKTVKLSPPVIARLARLGASLAGGVTGGALEGSHTYQEILNKGGTKDEAEAGAELMAVGSGALNALSFDVILRGMPTGFKNTIVKYITSGATEGLTEWLEEPWEGTVKMLLGHASLKDVVEQTKEGFNVFPIAAVTGLGGATAVQIMPSIKEREVGVKLVTEPVPTPVITPSIEPTPEAVGKPVVPIEKISKPQMPKQLEKIYDETMADLPPEIASQIKVKSILIGDFLPEYEGTGGRTLIGGSFNEPTYHIALERGETGLKDALKHELIHAYVLETGSRHPGYFGNERTVKEIEKELTAKPEMPTLPAKITPTPPVIPEVPITPITTKFNEKAFNVQSQDLYGKDWNKLTKVERHKTLQRTLIDPDTEEMFNAAIVPFTPENDKIIKPSNTPTTMAQDVLSGGTRNRTIPLLSNKSGEYFSDSHILIADKLIAPQLRQKARDKVKDIEIIKEINESTPPNYEAIIPSKDELANKRPAYIQGIHMTSNLENFVLSTGEEQLVVNANYYKEIKKYFPDAETYIVGPTAEKQYGDKKLVFLENNKVKTLVLPIRKEGLNITIAPDYKPEVEPTKPIAKVPTEKLPIKPVEEIAEPSIAKKLTSEQISFVKNRIRELKTVDAVFKAYKTKSDIDKYARAIAPKILAKKEIVEPEKLPEIEKAKEPWEMTREEYMDDFVERATRTFRKEIPDAPYRVLRNDAEIKSSNFHKEFVQKALTEGKPIPPEVLKDYPDLVKPEVKPPAKPPTKPAKPPAFSDLVIRTDTKPTSANIKTGSRLMNINNVAWTVEEIDKPTQKPNDWLYHIRNEKTGQLTKRSLDIIRKGHRLIPEIIEPKLLATKEQKAEGHMIAREKGIAGADYMNLAKEAIGKPSMTQMTELEATKFIDTLKAFKKQELMPKVRKIKAEKGAFIAGKEKPEFTFADKETEKRYQQSRGIEKEPMLQRIKGNIVNIAHKMTRQYEYLPRTKEFARLQFDLNKLAKQRRIVADKVLRKIYGITSQIDKIDYDLFNRKVILDDLIETAKEGKPLPLGFDIDSVTKESNRLEKHITGNEYIKDSINKRNNIWESAKKNYIDSMKSIGFDVSEKLTRKNYFRHQVLDYALVKGILETGKKLRTPVGRGFLKQRRGSLLDINTDYLQVEKEILAQMLYDTEIARTIKSIDDHYNIWNDLKKQAKKEGIASEDVILPEGYVSWQPREGSVFYLTDSIPARLAEQLTVMGLKEIGISEKDLRKTLAVGGKRKRFIIKEEIAQTLDNIVKPRSPSIIAQSHRRLLRAWKKWQLVSPKRYPKYNTRNLTGDADGAFAGSPKVFLKTPQAVKDLAKVFISNKELMGNIEDWVDRGGVVSTLQAQEMDELKNLSAFEGLYEEKTGALILAPWKKYWKIARMTTDFRESILRYAAYLHYFEDIKKHNGKPSDYGASKPEEIDGLDDYKDKAYWLQNDLLGAYDRVGVVGQALREHLWPFWSWKEVNFKRYAQLFANAANDHTITEKVGRKFVGGIVLSPYKAYKIGKFVLRASAFLAMVQVWNSFYFRDEEDELSDSVRNKPHVIFGRDANGNILYFSRIGALGDLLEWFNLDASPYYVNQFFKGKMTIKEIARDMAKEPLNILLQGSEPFAKMTYETLTKKALFPDVFKPSVVRDRGLHIARSFGLEEEYKELKGLPTRGYGKQTYMFFFYKSVPFEAAYWDITNEKRRFLEKKGKLGEGYWLSPKSSALYNVKLALRYKDTKAAEKYLLKYYKLGGTPDGIEQSIETMNPIFGLSKEEIPEFLNYLGEENIPKLNKAIDFYADIANTTGAEK